MPQRGELLVRLRQDPVSLPVTDLGDGLYRVLDPGGAVTASRVDDG